jgi:hypothetical protein
MVCLSVCRSVSLWQLSVCLSFCIAMVYLSVVLYRYDNCLSVVLYRYDNWSVCRSVSLWQLSVCLLFSIAMTTGLSICRSVSLWQLSVCLLFCIAMTTVCLSVCRSVSLPQLSVCLSLHQIYYLFVCHLKSLPVPQTAQSHCELFGTCPSRLSVCLSVRLTWRQEQ